MCLFFVDHNTETSLHIWPHAEKSNVHTRPESNLGPIITHHLVKLLLNFEPLDLHGTSDGRDDRRWRRKAEASRSKMTCLSFRRMFDQEEELASSKHSCCRMRVLRKIEASLLPDPPCLQDLIVRNA